MVFEKASTRTRASFEIAMFELGGHALYLGTQGSQLGRGEPIRDTARVLSGYCHGIMVRTFGQDRAEEMAQYARVPVINGLTDRCTPARCSPICRRSCSASRTTATSGRSLRSVKYAWIGDGNNMANSWIEAAGILGLDLTLACPAGFEPDPGIYERARATGARPHLGRARPRRGHRGPPRVSTDVFASMGQEEEAAARLQAFAGYRIDAALMARAADDAIVLHCLPAHRDEEITDDVIEGPAERRVAAGGESPARPEGPPRDAHSVVAAFSIRRPSRC